jgi:pyroglutamyl-peptidase
MGHLVVTGFEPFLGLPHNPSQSILALLPPVIAGREIRTAVLPVEGARIEAAAAALPWVGAELVLHLGLARERPVISVERLAVNLADYPDPDNAGEVVRGRAIVEGGPLALPTSLPVESILARWKSEGIPARASTSAGTYLCNQLFYLSLARSAPIPVGFVHLAPDERLALAAGTAYQPLAVQARAVALALEATLAGR